MVTNFWAFHAKRGFHPEDEGKIEQKHILDLTHKKWKGKKPKYKSDKKPAKKLHKSLYPIPFQGNLQKAKVFILFGNPSVGAKSYKREQSDAYLTRMLADNLLGRTEMFMDLDPKLGAEGHGTYWRGVFKSLAQEIAERETMEIDEAFDYIARNVAVLESCAYRSLKKPGRWAESLPSSIWIRDYVQQVLVPRALKGEIFLFVWRRAKFWNVNSSGKYIKKRETKRARSRYFAEEERKAIRKFLLD